MAVFALLGAPDWMGQPSQASWGEHLAQTSESLVIVMTRRQNV